VAHVQPLGTNDVDEVVERVTRRLRLDATINDLVSSEISRQAFADALHAATAMTWVARRADVIVGHLYGALLESAAYGHGVWIGPDGVSFDDADVLADLYAVAGQAWIDQGALEHYIWVLDDEASTAPWYELGFARMHARGVLALDHFRDHEVPRGYALRRGTLDDLDVAVELIEELDRAQAEGPSFSVDPDSASQRDELFETLSDPDVRYYLVESDGVAIGQCITFALPKRRGSFDNTLHLSAVVVREAHRHRGVAAALVDTALNEALAKGFRYVETNWRVTSGTGRHMVFVRPTCDFTARSAPVRRVRLRWRRRAPGPPA